VKVKVGLLESLGAPVLLDGYPSVYANIPCSFTNSAGYLSR